MLRAMHSLLWLVTTSGLLVLAGAGGNVSTPSCTDGSGCAGGGGGERYRGRGLRRRFRGHVEDCVFLRPRYRDQRGPRGSTTITSDVQVDGTIVFDADGNYQAAFTETGASHTTAPIGCLTPTGATTCAEVQQFQQTNQSDLGSYFVSLTCADATGDGCTCTSSVSG